MEPLLEHERNVSAAPDLPDLSDLLANASAPADQETVIPKVAGWVTSPNVSAAELRVLLCMSHGLTYQMTADMLGRSIETVKIQMMAARFKLRAKNSVHAACEAIRQGLIP